MTSEPDWQERALALVRAHQTRKPGRVPAVTTQMGAIALIGHGFADHMSSDNDRYAVAVICGLEGLAMRTAWWVVANGLNNYFEWRTHNSFRMEDIFVLAGIMTTEEAANPLGVTVRPSHLHDIKGYHTLKDEFLRRIVERYQLPTIREELGGSRVLGKYTARLRDELNALYDYKHIGEHWFPASDPERPQARVL